MAASLPRLPACQLCHQRKVKCDNGRPKCNPCTKSGSDCVIIRGENEQALTREYLHDLEQQTRALPTCHDLPNRSNEHVSPEADGSVTESRQSRQNNDLTLGGAAFRAGDGGGFRFMRSLFHNATWREEHADLLQNLARSPDTAEATDKPNLLPSVEDARKIFDKYLEGSHVQNPFILRKDVQSLYLRLFSQNDVPTSHDIFRCFMVLAIGAVNVYRNNQHSQHPFGYYLAAMKNFDPDFLANGVEAIQDLLLICRFGIYHHIGTSIWEIVHLCVRMCAEQELHRLPRRPIDLLQEQLNRRVFWECYMLDRYSSSILDRPFAISDSDIEIGFPADADDDDIPTAGTHVVGLDSFIATHTISRPNEVTVFLYWLHLRQITSRIHELSQIVDPDQGSHNAEQSLLATGKVFVVLDGVLQALDQWRVGAPIYKNPRCLYESQEWYDFLLSREKLQFIRRAMDVIPRSRGLPPQQLLTLCSRAAIQGIELFSAMLEKRMVTWTRSYFSFMFTAGLSIMFCMSASNGVSEREYQGEISQALTRCENTLKHMGQKLPDAKHYVTAFEVLHRNISTNASRSVPVSRPRTPGQPQSSLDVLAEVAYPMTHPIQLPANQQPSYQTQTPHLSHAAQPFRGIEPLQLTEPGNSSEYRMQGSVYENHNVFSNDAMLHGAECLPDDNVLHWAFLNDNTLWNMEAGLGEYAYGDPNFNMSFFNT
ncbi:fungal-specific transcription factor domain-containing protein [Hypoxylon sp. FL1150]|nr:fungal-specific transcription factor domain-containing protein [Hypoxylon sp. FL1150]